MKSSLLACGLLFAQSALGVKLNYRPVQKRDENSPVYPDVPTYNMSIPVDHFDTSNRRTYSNRYFVNDTFYQTGGPVILYDFGESGVSPGVAAEFIGGFNLTSAPIELAKKLNGLVIGWEHRYYGYSRPVDMDDESGLPVDGAEGYKYLTVEQAIEDVAYFANNFNTTQLHLNDNVQSTENLDPYHTPWISMGGSYPGMRASWLRVTHPEIIYASWASSAPVEAQPDGSIYYNPLVRSLPQNCTNDIEAVIKYVDDVMTSGTEAQVQQVQAFTYLLSTDRELKTAFSYDSFTIGSLLVSALTFGSSFQGFGPIHTVQVLCDYMETFDVESFISSVNSAETINAQVQAILDTPNGSRPTEKGVAASNGQDGGLLALCAFVYGYAYANDALIKFGATLPPSVSFTEKVDGRSWSWQTLDELGFFQGSNQSNPYQVVSKYYSVEKVRSLQVEGGVFSAFSQSDFPTSVNNSHILELGGWNMKASNVMFTNGEFDPWRSFSVSSEETKSGAPQRALTQSVPKCNELPSGTDVFGLLYAGAVHAEDMATTAYLRGSIEKTSPLQQGLALFLKAWDTWQPCFNESRDSIRNGQGVDGNGNGAGGNSDDESGAGSIVGKLNLVATMVAVVSAAFALL